MKLMLIDARRLTLAVATVLVAASCAGRAATPSALPVADRHPEFMYPVVPPALQQTVGADRIEPAWRLLQSGDTRNATREFEAALTRNPQLYPARAGEAYAALAR